VKRPRITLYRIVVLVLVLFLMQGATMAFGFYTLNRQATDDCRTRREGREAVRLLVVVATTGTRERPVDPNNPVVKALTDTLLPGHELDNIKC
jgi:hypothetical protein